MTPDLKLVQLSDAHLGADWELGHEPSESLAAVVEHSLRYEPDAVVLTGDVAEPLDSTRYEPVLEVLDRYACPVHVLPGNHDDRGAMREAFRLPGVADEPIQYSADLGPARLIVADSIVPGSDSGDLDPPRLDWLAEELQDARGTPVVLALHHTPLRTGIPAMDEMIIPEEARERLATLMTDHERVLAVIGGHVHRPVTSTLGTTPVFAAPSTYGQTRLRLDYGPLTMTGDDAAGYGLHLLAGGRLSSHAVSLPRP